MLESVGSLGGEESVLRRAVSGDELAIKSLLLRESAHLLAHIQARICGHLRGRVSAEDILQQVYIRAIRRMGHFKLDGQHAAASFRKWLETIAERLLIDAQRRRSSREQNISAVPNLAGQGLAESSAVDLGGRIEDSSPGPTEQAQSNDLKRVIHLTMHELPADYRQVVQLHYLDGLTLAEVASRLGKTEGQVRNFDRQAKKMMREILVRFSLYL